MSRNSIKAERLVARKGPRMDETNDSLDNYLDETDSKLHDARHEKANRYLAIASEVLPALRQELADLAAADATLRPRLIKEQKFWARPTWEHASPPKVTALAVGAPSTGGARTIIAGALFVLENHPAAIERHIHKIEAAQPERFKYYDPIQLANLDVEHARCLVGSAKGLPDAFDRLAEVRAEIARITAGATIRVELPNGPVIEAPEATSPRVAVHGDGTFGGER